MKRLAFLLLLPACGLSGDAEEDLETLRDAQTVDCNEEPTCGAQIHCMTDALRDGVVAYYYVRDEISPSNPNYYNDHYFTYDGDIVKITESHADPSYGDVWETHCSAVTAVPSGSCWKWSFEGCD